MKLCAGWILKYVELFIFDVDILFDMLYVPILDPLFKGGHQTNEKSI